MSTEVQTAPMPQKYSRYRSVRQAAAAQPPPPPSPVIEAKVQSNGPSRSMSRYRRPRAASAAHERKQPNTQAPPTPMIPVQYGSPSLSSTQSKARYLSNVDTNPNSRSVSQERGETAEERLRNEERLRALQSLEAGAPPPRKRSPFEEAARLAEQERLRQQRLRREEEMKKRAAEEEVKRILAEQKRKDLERLELELAAAVQKPMSPDKTSPTREFLNILTKKPTILKSSSATERARGNTVTTVKSNGNDSTNSGGFGRGDLPGIDAPISAVNAGERRVLIRFKQSSINLPVLPDTTAVDLAYSSANILSHHINPSSVVVLESYTKLGLERRIRRYEHVRDIMNSWDRDTQNALIIEESDSPGHDKDLHATAVSRERPSEITVLMHHSQKPGKWNKRYVTLQSSGQIFLSKKAGAISTDKDVLTICHLSDFDIYTPTQSQLKKTLKPPKKHCYAIKSQQKTTMFLSTENFVHFFSTDDSDLANEWYDAVQKWRSWYLIHHMGEGQKKSASKPEATFTLPFTRSQSKSGAVPRHTVKVSVDETPYTIGTFKPLLDMNRFDNPSSEIDEDDENRPRQIPFHLRHSVVAPKRPHERHPPPVSLTRKGCDVVDSPPLQEAGTFSPTGLLGRTYTQRQRAQKDKEKDADNGPFISGPSLLNSTGAFEAPLTRPATSGGIRASRSLSVRSKRPMTSGGVQIDSDAPPMPKLKPLVDLTPTFVEAPQRRTEGKGHGVAAPAGVPLVDIATTPDLGLVVPFNNVFRREDTTKGAGSYGTG